jgi:hypothetical protein
MTGTLQLKPHPAGPAGPVRSLTATVHRDRSGLRLRYVLAADLAQVQLPALQPPARADRLWEHTCFEAFVSVVATPGYREFNFSPSSCWAAWDFAAYRQGMAPAGADLAPAVTRETGDAQLVVTAQLPGELLPDADRELRLALAAVIEDAAGQRSYWALHHPAAQPDFHAAGSFALALPAVPAP